MYALLIPKEATDGEEEKWLLCIKKNKKMFCSNV